MLIGVEKRGQVTVVSVEGSVDGTTAGELIASLRGQVSGGSHHLVGNLAGVDYMSSAGLRALLRSLLRAFAERSEGPGDASDTDGVTEAKDGSRRFFSEEKLLALIAERAPSASALLDRIEAAVSAHSSGAERSDDITMLAVRRTG